MKKKELIDLIEPKSNSTILIYDVHASESGALSILNDLYKQICLYKDKSINWIFIVSTPTYEEKENIKVFRYPWIKKSWIHRYFFDNITARKIIKKHKPDKIFSLQNMGIPFYHGKQYVYLHLPFILTNHKFKIKKDGLKLWVYQNILSKKIFRSLKKVDMTIVQTMWMKNALIDKVKLKPQKIELNYPNISTNNIGVYKKTKGKIKFFYPATAFSYKNHFTLLKAIKYISDTGIKDYEVFLTIKNNENKYTESLYQYAMKNNLNIIFNGPIEREKVFEMYTNSILLFPSYVESFGLPLLEAKMTGTPIVASDCPFSNEILKDYNNKLFFNPDDHVDMANKILKIIKKG